MDWIERREEDAIRCLVLWLSACSKIYIDYPSKQKTFNLIDGYVRKLLSLMILLPAYSLITWTNPPRLLSFYLTHAHTQLGSSRSTLSHLFQSPLTGPDIKACSPCLTYNGLTYMYFLGITVLSLSFSISNYWCILSLWFHLFLSWALNRLVDFP